MERLDTATMNLTDVRTYTCEGCQEEQRATLEDLLVEEGHACKCGKRTRAKFYGDNGEVLDNDRIRQLGEGRRRFVQDWQRRTYGRGGSD